MRKNNIFVVGGQVSGSSFFGRSEELGKLTRQFRDGNRGRAIIGMNRIGKSSLINQLLQLECHDQQDILLIRHEVKGNGSAQDFWTSFLKMLWEEMERLHIQDSEIDRDMKEILGIRETPPEPEPVAAVAEPVKKKGLANLLHSLFAKEKRQDGSNVQSCAEKPVATTIMRSDFCNHLKNVNFQDEFNSRIGKNIEKIMERLGKLNYRVVIILDEFDGARALFKKQSGSLSVIRGLATGANMSHVAVYTLSRRTLEMIEKGIAEAHVDSTSTLSGAFDNLRLPGFSDSDMEQFWDALLDYDIFADNELKARIQYYSGNHPYLLSFYGNRIADYALTGKNVTANLIDQIHSREWLQNLKGHYDTWVKRMKEDGYAQDLRGILCGPINGITQATVDGFLDAGYLGNDSEGFYTISRDFTTYFLTQTTDLTSPIWDVIMTAERFLKQLMVKEYPKLETLRYLDIAGKTGWAAGLRRDYPALRLNEVIVEKGMKRTHDTYGSNPTIIEALMLSYVVDHILAEWALFRKYFHNEAASDWKRDLELIAKARNALAHACPEYLNTYETDTLPASCNKVNALNS